MRGELLEALDRRGLQQRVAVGEVVVGGRVGDAGASGDLAEGRPLEPALADQLHRRVDQGAPEVAVVVGPGGIRVHRPTLS